MKLSRVWAPRLLSSDSRSGCDRCSMQTAITSTDESWGSCRFQSGLPKQCHCTSVWDALSLSLSPATQTLFLSVIKNHFFFLIARKLASIYWIASVVMLDLVTTSAYITTDSYSNKNHIPFLYSTRADSSHRPLPYRINTQEAASPITTILTCLYQG